MIWLPLLRPLEICDHFQVHVHCTCLHYTYIECDQYNVTVQSIVDLTITVSSVYTYYSQEEWDI